MPIESRIRNGWETFLGAKSSPIDIHPLNPLYDVYFNSILEILGRNNKAFDRAELIE
jgi:hypothetical protein